MIILTEDKNIIELLSAVDAQQVLLALFSEQSDMPDMSPLAEMAYVVIKAKNDRLQEKQAGFSLKQSEKGKKGGAPIGNSNAKKQAETSQNNPEQAETSLTDSVTDSVTDSTTGDTPQPPHVAEHSELEKALDDFVTMRNKIKKPATARALGTIRKKLQDLAPNDEQTQVLILEQSIERCWQTVYPLKDDYSANNRAPPKREQRPKNIYAELAEKARAEELESVVIVDDTG